MDQFSSPQVKNAVLSVAFEKAWSFVEKDPLLAHNRKAALQSRLRTYLEYSIRNGERNTLNLANEAIRNLRTELALPPERPRACTWTGESVRHR
ncbi:MULTISPECIES: hypothetical protein [unclassified Bradyrhizobium]|uniref:hypothetical protein n=1 Tax=unclassified Bradyrhizobium TaxID=2631580 RepID=UPI002305B51A|nr:MULTISPECIES: hypothetical protein [unclassified Bradyrhizobium]